MIVAMMLDNTGSKFGYLWIGVQQNGLGILLPSPVLAIDHIHPVRQSCTCCEQRAVKKSIGVSQVIH
jgi:hypothetical protein